MTDRHLIVVDVETNGLDFTRHQAVEVAWWNLTTDARGCFVPKQDWREVVAAADLRALQVNGYIERIASRPQDYTGAAADELWGQLCRVPDEDIDEVPSILIGSNPRLDAAMLSKLFRSTEATLELDPEPWHYRLWDIGAYAAGVLGLDEVPGLWDVCTTLGIEPGDHSAEADVTATGLAFRELQRRAGAR